MKKQLLALSLLLAPVWASAARLEMTLQRGDEIQKETRVLLVGEHLIYEEGPLALDLEAILENESGAKGKVTLSMKDENGQLHVLGEYEVEVEWEKELVFECPSEDGDTTVTLVAHKE